MIRLERWANAVASAGTRAIAPPSVRSCVTRNTASEAWSRSTIVSAVPRSTRSRNIVLPAGREPGNPLRRGGQDQHPPDDPGELVQAVPNPGGHAEVPTPAADRPEQIRFVVLVDQVPFPVGRDDLGREQRVDSEPLLADEVPDPAAQRDAADPDRTGIPEPDRQIVLRGRGGDLER